MGNVNLPPATFELCGNSIVGWCRNASQVNTYRPADMTTNSLVNPILQSLGGRGVCCRSGGGGFISWNHLRALSIRCRSSNARWPRRMTSPKMSAWVRPVRRRLRRIHACWCRVGTFRQRTSSFTRATMARAAGSNKSRNYLFLL